MFDIIIIFIILLSMVSAFFKGFIKEIFGLLGVIFVIFLTFNYYSFLADSYYYYTHNELTSNILSAISIFIILSIIIVFINTWISQLLLSVRLGIIDRSLGVLLGVGKGLIFSYLLFIMTKAAILTLSPLSINQETKKMTREERRKEEEKKVYPSWFIESHSYKVFKNIDNYISELIPHSFYEKIENIGSDIQGVLHKKDEEEKKENREKMHNKKISNPK